MSQTSSSCNVETCSDGVIRKSLESHGLSPQVAKFLLGSWRDTTKQQYRPHIEKWLHFCVNEKIDPFQPPVNLLLEFLLIEFKKGRKYSTMNILRSSISAIANIDGKPAGQNRLVSRFMKAVFQERPALPRYNITWDPDVVLEHIKSLGPNKYLSMIQLSQKLVMLMLLLSGQRCQTLHSLDIRNMTITSSKVAFTIGDILKTSGPKSHLSQIRFKAYAPDRRLCVHTTIRNYLERTLDIRGKVTSLFVTTKPLGKPASKDTLRRWTKGIMKDAGINLSMFTPHSTRSASSSKAAKYLPLSTIVETIGWSRQSTFTTYYHKPVRELQFDDAVLV